MTIAIVLIAVVAILIISIFRIKKGDTEVLAIQKSLVEEYCNFIKNRNYEEAYEMYNSRFKKEISFEKFATQLQKKQLENGLLLNKEYAKHHKSYNLFSRITEYQIFYHLTFEKNKIYGAIIINNQDKTLKIEGTYIDSANDTLSYYLW